MPERTKSLLTLVFIGIFTIWGSTIFSQNFRFKTFGPEDGLADNFIYNINQDPNGYLWLGTGEGISRYDGFNFIKEFQGDQLPRSPVRRSFRDSRNHIWFGYDNGSIAILEGTRFRLIEPEESFRNAIKGFTEDQNGNILVATQAKGIIKVEPDFNISYISKGLEDQFISSICITEKGELLVGSFDGLFIYKYSAENNTIELTGRIEDIPYTNVLSITRNPLKSEYYIGTEDEGLFLLTEPDDDSKAYSISSVGHEFGLRYSNIQDIYHDSDNNLWLAVEGQGAVKLTKDKGSFILKYVFNESKGLNTRYIRNIFEDGEGNFWFASYGDGLAVLRSQYFLFYSFPTEKFDNNVLSLFAIEETYWLGGENGILKVDLSEEIITHEFLGQNYGLPNDKITALMRDSKGDVWVGTSKSGIYKIPSNATRAERFFFSPNSLENIINSLAYNNSKIYSATNGGLIIFDLQTRQIEKLTTNDGLPHNRIREVFIDSGGNTWIATRSNGIYNIDSKNELTIEGAAELEFISVAEDKNGNLWAATNGDGVFLFSDDSLEHYSTANGLRSNYCYSLSVDANGIVWVGHSLGMSRIDPHSKHVQVFSVEQGISASCNYNAVIKNNKGNLIFGTSDGIIVYDHTREKYDNRPPKLNITSLKINDQDHDFTQPVVLPYNKYKIRIEFIGINLRNPERVTYQYKLQADDEWSDITTVPFAYYPVIADGEYTFLLRACDDRGVCTEEPLSLKITIKIPVWKTWWFILLTISLIVALVYVIIKLRERKQKQIQEYLEKLLDERTREVRAQKEEIENKNRDITDSINYAQRIQASILPPVNRLNNQFSGSFVFYQPKDIVSGDFYWYDKVWGNKFLIVCADSTGHGVPGAFMSMIGTTLIKDICARPEVRSPSALLTTLDDEVKEALNQNKEAEKSNDGMDIIVAEIDLETKELRVASAMRPLIIYINGKQTYVKGSRSSVGGRLDEDFEDEKEFIDEKFPLSKGDIIYMFSDGYSDQFGGPLGKKFKMVRLKNLLRDIHEKSMDEQYQQIKNNFFLWKEDLEQVDDVLFMGIKI